MLLPLCCVLAWGEEELSPRRWLLVGDKRSRVSSPEFVSAALYLRITPGSWSITPLQSSPPRWVACSPFRTVTEQKDNAAQLKAPPRAPSLLLSPQWAGTEVWAVSPDHRFLLTSTEKNVIFLCGRVRYCDAEEKPYYWEVGWGGSGRANWISACPFIRIMYKIHQHKPVWMELMFPADVSYQRAGSTFTQVQIRGVV